MQPTVRQRNIEGSLDARTGRPRHNRKNSAYRAITVKRCSPRIGAEIGNIDLTRPLSELELSELKRAFTENMVIFFRDQKISFQDQARLAEYFGPVGQHVGKKETHSNESEESPRAQVPFRREAPRFRAMRVTPINRVRPSRRSAASSTFTPYRRTAVAIPCSPACTPPTTRSRTG